MSALSSFPHFSTTTTSLPTIHIPTLTIVPPLPRPHSSTLSLTRISSNTLTQSLKASTQQQQKYIYPDPIPEFAESETLKFKSALVKKLSTNKEFGDDLHKVVTVCVEIFKNFLHKEYGGPGTLLVEPFTDMFVALKEEKLPGAPEAARAALLWAQNYLDKDWEIWVSKQTK